ncbi:MAG TPA: hypothetical protein VMV69_13360 [Pirellulales bacterium]|nr:hypothetical protein [Pirellulales bacterium]
MPVLFNCQHCHQPIRASRRKGGTVVACPQCGQSNTVPAVPMGDAAGAPSPPPKGAEKFAAGAGGFDDIPDLIAPSAMAAGPLPPPVFAAGLAPPVPGGMPVPPTNPRRSAGISTASIRNEDALLVISRRGVYALGALLLLVALVFLLAGYLMGRGRAASARGHDATSESSGTPVVFEGNLLYVASPGQIKPDADAVVIALPFDKRPNEKLASRGLRSTDTGDIDATPAALALNALGGACARADGNGEFPLVVPRPGKYYLLLISKHAQRDAGRTIEFDDLRAMSDYFNRPADLVGAYRYDWSVRELAGAPPRFTHEF